MRNNEELRRSHANGFGGSDAKMFAKIGHVGIWHRSVIDD